MSGICGWNNNQLALETGSSTLRRMLAEQTINPNHAVNQTSFNRCVLATVGFPYNSGICQQNQVTAAVQGNLLWADSELTQTATQHGPAHAVVEAYRKYGIDFLRNASGSFVLSIVDEANDKTLLAIDRLGINSLFYTVRRGQLIFASNARAMRRHPDVDGGIDPQGIFDYLYFHMVPSPGCIFNGVSKLLPGQYLLFENNKPSTGFYWQPTYVESSTASLDALKSNFLQILKASVGRAAESAKTGAFLSGGTDSSTVAGMLRQIRGRPIDTYSIGFDAEGYDEMAYARIATRHFDTSPHEYYLTPQDVVDAVPLIAKAYDEPFGNASAVPAYYCAKLARADGIDTLLAGDGGDELFGGNERYATQKIFEFYQEIPEPLRRWLIEPAVFNMPSAEKIRLLAKAQSYIRQAKVPLPDRLESYNLLNRMPLAHIFHADFLATVNIDAPLNYSRDTYRRAEATSSLNRMLFLDLKFTLADNDLRKVNRMCELAQIDVRYPLLDDEMLRFSTELPTSLKLRGLKLRYFFKQAVKGFLPQEILNKSKHGFGLPFGLWMSTHEPLREMAYENLVSLSRRGMVKPEFIQDLQQRHQEHPSYYGITIWVLVMLEQWLQSTGG